MLDPVAQFVPLFGSSYQQLWLMKLVLVRNPGAKGACAGTPQQQHCWQTWQPPRLASSPLAGSRGPTSLARARAFKVHLRVGVRTSSRASGIA